MPELAVPVDRFLQTIGPEHLATCVYAIYGPSVHQVEVALAGHLPPLIGLPGVEPGYPELPSGRPLGVGGARFSSTTLNLPVGSLVLLYTDGLVEGRDCPVEEGMRRLRSAVGSDPARPPSGVDPARSLGGSDPARPLNGPDPGRSVGGPDPARPGGPDPEVVADSVLRALGRDGDHDDDVALLAVTVTEARHTRTQLPNDAHAARDARRFVTRVLAEWGLSDLADTAALLVSEVATNAIRYGEPPYLLTVTAQEGVLRVTVTDHGQDRPRARHALPAEVTGRGLLVIDVYADAWGYEPLASGKQVWFELRTGR